MSSYINTCSFKNYLFKEISQNAVAGHRSWITQNRLFPKVHELTQRRVWSRTLVPQSSPWASPGGSGRTFTSHPGNRTGRPCAHGYYQRQSRLWRDVRGPAPVTLCCRQLARRQSSGAALSPHAATAKQAAQGGHSSESPCCTWRPRVSHWPRCAHCCDPYWTQERPRGPVAQMPRGRQDSWNFVCLINFSPPDGVLTSLRTFYRLCFRTSFRALLSYQRHLRNKLPTQNQVRVCFQYIKYI